MLHFTVGAGSVASRICSFARVLLRSMEASFGTIFLADRSGMSAASRSDDTGGRCGSVQQHHNADNWPELYERGSIQVARTYGISFVEMARKFQQNSQRACDDRKSGLCTGAEAGAGRGGGSVFL
jgi:hypothetical protein